MPSSFLEDLVGRRLAHDPLSLFVPGPDHGSVYGLGCSCGGDSYLSVSFSSVWALLVLLAAFAAGIIFRSKKKSAFWMLGCGAALSLLDTGVRVIQRLDRPAPYRDLMLDRLPEQVMANAVFQLALPFVAGVTLAFAGAGLKRLFAAGRVRLVGER